MTHFTFIGVGSSASSSAISWNSAVPFSGSVSSPKVGLMPITGPCGAMARVSRRSTGRPDPSDSRTVIRASSGPVASSIAGNSTGITAWPLSSVRSS